MKWITCFLLLSVSSLCLAQEYGLASYYSDAYQGLKTASGERYDKTQLTCAHNTHPFGTMIRVTRLDNKKSVVVRVIDRGPFIKGRIVDVSRAAAEELDLIRPGKAQVKVELASAASSNPVATTATTRPQPKARPVGNTSRPKTIKTADPVPTTPRPKTYVDKNVPKNTSVKSSRPNSYDTTTKGRINTTPKKEESAKPATKYNTYGLYQIEIKTPKKRGYGVQIASLNSHENMMKKVASLQSKWFDEILVNIEPTKSGQPSYKIVLGNFDTQAAANNYKKNLKSKHKINGFVVNLGDTKK